MKASELRQGEKEGVKRKGGRWDDTNNFWLSPLFRTASGGGVVDLTTNTHANLLCGVLLS